MQCDVVGEFGVDGPSPCPDLVVVGVEEFELVEGDCRPVFRVVGVHVGNLGPRHRIQGVLVDDLDVETRFVHVVQPLVAFLAHAPWLAAEADDQHSRVPFLKASALISVALGPP